MFDAPSLQDKGHDAQVPPTPTSLTTSWDAASQAVIDSQAQEIENLKAMVLKLSATQSSPTPTASPAEAPVGKDKPGTTPFPSTSASPPGHPKSSQCLTKVKQPKDEAEAVRNLKAMSQEELQERFDTYGEDL